MSYCQCDMDRIDDIRKRLESIDSDVWAANEIGEIFNDRGICVVSFNQDEYDEDNERFIENATTDIRFLIDEVERLNNELTKYKYRSCVTCKYDELDAYEPPCDKCKHHEPDFWQPKESDHK